MREVACCVRLGKLVITRKMSDSADTQMSCLSVTDLSQVRVCAQTETFEVLCSTKTEPKLLVLGVCPLHSARALAIVACTNKLSRAAAALAFRCAQCHQLTLLTTQKLLLGFAISCNILPNALSDDSGNFASAQAKGQTTKQHQTQPAGMSQTVTHHTTALMAPRQILNMNSDANPLTGAASTFSRATLSISTASMTMSSYHAACCVILTA